MGYVTVSVDVDVDLSDIDTEDLVEELNRRKYPASVGNVDSSELLERMH